jgi:hypothetical protein
MEYSLTEIEDVFDIENKQELQSFLLKYPKIKTFLINNKFKFKSIADFPLILSANLNPPCNCTDQEEDLLWVCVSAGNMDREESDRLEDEILEQILSPNWFEIDGRVGFIVI